jgi:hypothetical protein
MEWGVRVRVIEVMHLIWIDSESTNEWTEVSNLNSKLTEIHSVGFLVHQDKERYVLAVSYDSDNDAANGIMYIPKKAVKKVRPLCAIKTTT